MNTEIVKLQMPELQAIEKSRADQIRSTFEPMVEMLQSFENMYNNIVIQSEKGITESLCLKAKRCRLDIGKVRIETGKLKDRQKEYIKLEDKAIMGVHNILVWAVKEREDKLKGIEDYYEIQEQKKLEMLQSERAEKLSKYIDDADARNLSGMDEDVWNAYYQSKKREYEDRIAAEKEAEKLRIEKEKAEKQEQERIRKENDLLRAEAEKAHKKAEAEAVERAKAEKIRLEKEAKERSEREKKERKEREVYQAKIKAEQLARAKLEAELKAKAEAEAERIRQAEANKQAELNKGDSEKVKDLIEDLRLIGSKYTFKSDKNKKMYADVNHLIQKIIKHIQGN